MSWLGNLGAWLTKSPVDTSGLDQTRPISKADLIWLKLKVRGVLGTPTRVTQIIATLEELETLIDQPSRSNTTAAGGITADAGEATSNGEAGESGQLGGTDTPITTGESRASEHNQKSAWKLFNDIISELNQPRWVPLLPILWVWVPIAIVLFLFLKPAVMFGNPDNKDVLGIDSMLFWGAFVFGFAGSFIRVLNRAVSSDYFGLIPLTLLLVGLLRPLAGAVIGLFIVVVLSSGIINFPLGSSAVTSVGGLTTGEAIILALAFVGGLVDDLVINIASRITKMVRPDRNQERAESPEGDTRRS